MPIATSTCITKLPVSAFSFEGANVRILDRFNKAGWALADIFTALTLSNARNVAAKLYGDAESVQILSSFGGPLTSRAHSGGNVTVLRWYARVIHVLRPPSPLQVLQPEIDFGGLAK